MKKIEEVGSLPLSNILWEWIGTCGDFKVRIS